MSECLFDYNFHCLVATLHDVDTLLRLVETLALKVVVFSLVVGNGVEAVDGCSAVAYADAEHLGASMSRRVVYHVSTEWLACHLLYLCLLQQLGRVHQLVALHDVAVVVSILAELLLGVETLELIVAISSF